MYYCDVGDRVVVVDDRVHGKEVVDQRESTTALAGTLTIVTRATGKRVSAPMTGAIVDHCGGLGGGHAGCSESGGTFIQSKLLGKSSLSFRPGHDDAIVNPDDTEVACHEPPDFAPLTCVTRSWAVSVAGDAEYGFALAVFPFDGDKPLASERAVVVTRERYAGKHATYFFGGGKRSVQLDGAREDCY